MNLRTVRTGLIAAAVATSFLAVPAESHAIFHWLSRCCGGGTTPTYGTAPVYGTAAPADPCCAPPQITQTANYVPQTCYRTQYVSVPVTTYRPVVSRDPCTGCPVTCMRPTTCYVQQARLVPYTTYRMVLSNPCCGGATPAVAAGYAPAYSAGVGYAAGSSCSGCGTAAPMTYAPATSAPYYGAATSGTIVSPSNGFTPSNGTSVGAPTLAPSLGNTGTPTFQPTQKPIPKIIDVEPAPEDSSESGTTSGTGATLSPRLFQPNDRTTSYPILRAGAHRPVSYNEPAPEEPAQRPRRPVDDGGWRPSTR